MRTQKLSGLVVFLSSVIALSSYFPAHSDVCTGYYPIIPCSVTAPECSGDDEGCPSRQGSEIFSNSFIKDNVLIASPHYKLDIKAYPCYTVYACSWNSSSKKCELNKNILIQSYTQNASAKVPCVSD